MGVEGCCFCFHFVVAVVCTRLIIAIVVGTAIFRSSGTTALLRVPILLLPLSQRILVLFLLLLRRQRILDLPGGAKSSESAADAPAGDGTTGTSAAEAGAAAEEGAALLLADRRVAGLLHGG